MAINSLLSKPKCTFLSNGSAMTKTWILEYLQKENHGNYVAATLY